MSKKFLRPKIAKIFINTNYIYESFSKYQMLSDGH